MAKPPIPNPPKLNPRVIEEPMDCLVLLPLVFFLLLCLYGLH